MNRKHDFYPKSTPFALAKAQTKVGAQDHERYPATSGQSTVALARGHMRRDHLFISTQFIEILGGYKCKSPHPERGAQKGGKSQSSNRSRSHRSFHTSPPELGRWRQPAASFRLPLCFLHPHRTQLASVQAETRVNRSGRISTRTSASPCVRFLVARVCVAAPSS